MLDWVFRGIMEWIGDVVTKGLDYISTSFFDIFTLDMGLMNKIFPFLSTAFTLIQYFAFGLVIAILIFQLFRNFLGPISDAEAPLPLLGRTCIAAFCVFNATDICEYILKFARPLFQSLKEIQSLEGQSANKEHLFSGLYEQLNSGSDIAAGAANQMLSNNPALALIFLVLIIAIGWNVLKLILEAVERYIVCGVLYFLSPLGFATAGSKSTWNIFKAFCRMFGSEVLLIVLNVWFIRGFNSAMGQIVSGSALIEDGSIAGWIANIPSIARLIAMLCLLAYLKVAQRFDAYLAQLGLNTAQTGGFLAAEVALAARSVGNIANRGANILTGGHNGVAGAIFGRNNANNAATTASGSLTGVLNGNGKGVGGNAANDMAQKFFDPNGNKGLSFSGTQVNSGSFKTTMTDADGNKTKITAEKDSQGNWTMTQTPLDANGKELKDQAKTSKLDSFSPDMFGHSEFKGAPSSQSFSDILNGEGTAVSGPEADAIAKQHFDPDGSKGFEFSNTKIGKGSFESTVKDAGGTSMYKAEKNDAGGYNVTSTKLDANGMPVPGSTTKKTVSGTMMPDAFNPTASKEGTPSSSADSAKAPGVQSGPYAVPTQKTAAQQDSFFAPLPPTKVGEIPSLGSNGIKGGTAGVQTKGTTGTGSAGTGTGTAAAAPIPFGTSLAKTHGNTLSSMSDSQINGMYDKANSALNGKSGEQFTGAEADLLAHHAAQTAGRDGVTYSGVTFGNDSFQGKEFDGQSWNNVSATRDANGNWHETRTPVTPEGTVPTEADVAGVAMVDNLGDAQKSLDDANAINAAQAAQDAAGNGGQGIAFTPDGYESEEQDKSFTGDDSDGSLVAGNEQDGFFPEEFGDQQGNGKEFSPDGYGDQDSFFPIDTGEQQGVNGEEHNPNGYDNQDSFFPEETGSQQDSNGEAFTPDGYNAQNTIVPTADDVGEVGSYDASEDADANGIAFNGEALGADGTPVAGSEATDTSADVNAAGADGTSFEGNASADAHDTAAATDASASADVSAGVNTNDTDAGSYDASTGVDADGNAFVGAAVGADGTSYDSSAAADAGTSDSGVHTAEGTSYEGAASDGVSSDAGTSSGVPSDADASDSGVHTAEGAAYEGSPGGVSSDAGTSSGVPSDAGTSDSGVHAAEGASYEGSPGGVSSDAGTSSGVPSDAGTHENTPTDVSYEGNTSVDSGVQGSTPSGASYGGNNAAQAEAAQPEAYAGDSRGSGSQGNAPSGASYGSNNAAQAEAAQPEAYTGDSRSAGSQGNAPSGASYGSNNAAQAEVAQPEAYTGDSRGSGAQGNAPANASYGSNNAARAEAAQPEAYTGDSRSAGSQGNAPANASYGSSNAAQTEAAQPEAYAGDNRGSGTQGSAPSNASYGSSNAAQAETAQPEAYAGDNRGSGTQGNAPASAPREQNSPSGSNVGNGYASDSRSNPDGSYNLGSFDTRSSNAYGDSTGTGDRRGSTSYQRDESHPSSDRSSGGSSPGSHSAESRTETRESVRPVEHRENSPSGFSGQSSANQPATNTPASTNTTETRTNTTRVERTVEKTDRSTPTNGNGYQSGQPQYPSTGKNSTERNANGPNPMQQTPVTPRSAVQTDANHNGTSGFATGAQNNRSTSQSQKRQGKQGDNSNPNYDQQKQDRARKKGKNHRRNGPKDKW